MAYVSVPDDLSKIRTKVVFNLIKHQLLCFGTAAVVGISPCLFTRTAIGDAGAMLLMTTFVLPYFLIAMYERDGQPLEKVVRNTVHFKPLWLRTRPHRTQNFYSYLDNPGKEVSPDGTKNETPTRSREKRKT